MADRISSRQHQILALLLENKAGLSIDEIAGALDISRNAVKQHFSSLERGGYIVAGALNKTAGRPVRKYIISETGINCFPKQYAWFTELILADLKDEMGSEALQNFLKKLAYSLAQNLLPRFEGKITKQRIEELIKTMDELGYQAKVTEDQQMQEQYIDACNCIYHDNAQKYQEVCEFDKALISSLLDKKIELMECMAKGGYKCRFKIL